MITITGDSVWPKGSAEGDDGVPSLHAIGVGLGRMPRFAGQIPHFYPVFCHVLTVADLVEREHRVYALLHDAPEAIVGDVPSTWKTAEAKLAELDLLERITRSVGLPWPWPQTATDEVKRADLICLAAEAHVLGHAEAAKWWPGADTDPITALARRNTKRQLADARYWLEAAPAGYEFAGQVGDCIEEAQR